MAGMLSKGIKLSYCATSSGTFTELTNLQEVPNMGGSVDKVEITTLSNSAHTYIKGLKDYGDMDFKFLYDNSDSTSNYRLLKGLEDAGGQYYWKVEFPDAPTGTGTHNGTIFAFQGEPSVSVDSQGINVATTFTLSIAVSSDIEVTNPA